MSAGEGEDEDEDNKELQEFAARCVQSWTSLFALAQAKEEVQFALAMTPEMRGMQDAGWSTAEDTSRALQEYKELIPQLTGPISVRIGLSLYSHLSEASGYYEVPKNMMRIASGDEYNLWPFRHLVERHAATGAAIAPNSNKVMKDLIGHAEELGLDELVALILETFDPDIRNGYAHADYIIWKDGIRLRKRNGGQSSIVSVDTFLSKLNKAIIFFETIREVSQEFIRTYCPPKKVFGQMNNKDPKMPALITYDPEKGTFRIEVGYNAHE